MGRSTHESSQYPERDSLTANPKGRSRVYQWYQIWNFRQVFSEGYRSSTLHRRSGLLRGHPRGLLYRSRGTGGQRNSACSWGPSLWICCGARKDVTGGPGGHFSRGWSRKVRRLVQHGSPSAVHQGQGRPDLALCKSKLPQSEDQVGAVSIIFYLVLLCIIPFKSFYFISSYLFFGFMCSVAFYFPQAEQGRKNIQQPMEELSPILSACTEESAVKKTVTGLSARSRTGPRFHPPQRNISSVVFFFFFIP